MIIEHIETQHQHNVLVKSDNGELLGIVTNRYGWRAVDWRVFNANGTQISDKFKGEFNDNTSLDEILRKIQEMGEEPFNEPGYIYVVRIKTEYGFTQYYAEDVQSGGYPMAVDGVGSAKSMLQEKAEAIADKINSGGMSISTNYVDDKIAEAQVCELQAVLVTMAS